MIPVYITVHNRLTFTRGMVEYLLACPGIKPIIVDNASSYPPLLDWYSCGGCPVQVIRRATNGGPRAAWEHFGLDEYAYYAVTDCDLDLSRCPIDLVQHLIKGLVKHPAYCKAGLSLALDDLPSKSPLYQEIHDIEDKYWSKPLDSEWFDANVDTTFAVYRGFAAPCLYGPALRSGAPYTARHLPWYTLPGQETPEEIYYLDHLEFQSGLYWSVRQKETNHAALHHLPLPDVQTTPTS